MKTTNTQYGEVLANHNLKPRERMQSYGAETLTDTELLCVILGSGIKGSPVLQISKKVLEKIDQSKEKIDLSTIQDIPGLGNAKALRILATLELGKRIFLPRKWKITKPYDLIPLLSHYADREEENFIVCTLNGAHEIISNTVISRGVLNKTLAHPREVFKQAIKDNAASIIVAHNHPSGYVEPSPEDIEVTENLVSAGKILGINVLDHIVFTVGEFYSFNSKGLL